MDSLQADTMKRLRMVSRGTESNQINKQISRHRQESRIHKEFIQLSKKVEVGLNQEMANVEHVWEDVNLISHQVNTN